MVQGTPNTPYPRTRPSHCWPARVRAFINDRTASIPTCNPSLKMTPHCTGFYRFKLFDADVPTLQAIQQNAPHPEVMVGLSNDDLSALVASPAAAIDALRPLQPFGKMIRYVAVGSEPNEVAGLWEANATALAAVLIPALENIVAALGSLEGLKNAKAVVPLTMAVMDGYEKPPPHRLRRRKKQRSDGLQQQQQQPLPAMEDGRFAPAWDGAFIQPLLRVLDEAGSAFVVNVHPYGMYKDHSRTVDIGFATGGDSRSSNSSSLLGVLHDTVVVALTRAGYPDLPIVIGETGWPSAGGVGASVGNACRYIRSTIGNTAREGTPLRPGQGVELYLFEAFDEGGKEAAFGGVEAHWGVMKEDGEAKYPVDWAGGWGVDCES